MNTGSTVCIQPGPSGATAPISQRYAGCVGTVIRLRQITDRTCFAYVRIDGIDIMVDAANLIETGVVS